MFLENVKYLEHHDDEKTFKRIQDELKTAGYYIKAEVLNSMTHGNVPQARERIYIVGFRTPSMRGWITRNRLPSYLSGS